jgi:uncharacterized membrane protein
MFQLALIGVMVIFIALHCLYKYMTGKDGVYVQYPLFIAIAFVAGLIALGFNMGYEISEKEHQQALHQDESKQ